MKKFFRITFCKLYYWNVRYYLSVDKENSAQTAALCMVLLLIANLASFHMLFSGLFQITLINSMSTAMLIIFGIGTLIYIWIYVNVLAPKKYLKVCQQQANNYRIGKTGISHAKLTILYIVFTLVFLILSVVIYAVAGVRS